MSVNCLGFILFTSSSSRLSDGNSSLPDEGGSASQVPQASVQLFYLQTINI